MGLKALYTALEARLRLIVDSNNNAAFKHYHTWNNDLEDIMAGKGQVYPHPACLMEIVVENIEQLGNGNQLLFLNVNLHIVHEKLHAGSEFEQNWDVLDLADLVYQFIQKWKTTNTSEFIRIDHRQDFNHKMLYHFIQTYKTTFEDTLMDEPVNRYLHTGLVTAIVDINIRPTINGPVSVTHNTTVIYNTEANMTNYSWTVTGGTIASGGTSTDNTVSVLWGSAGVGKVTVNYENQFGKTAPIPTEKNITIT